MFSTPEQAEAFTDSLRSVMERGRVITDPQGNYARRLLPGVEIPLALAEHLPTGLETPPRGDVTVTLPVGTMSQQQQPSLKLSWEYNPINDRLTAGEDLNIINMKESQRGWPFTMWRADPRVGTMEHASGFTPQLPSSFFNEGDPEPEESFRRFEEASDRIRIAHARAEAQAWQNAEMGITNPRVGFTEADVLIDFVKSLRR